MNKITSALVLAAITAATVRHYDRSGFGINRAEYRRRYGKRKGGGRGLGMISGLPKSSTCRAYEAPRKQCGHRNLADWERKAQGLS